MGTKEHEIDPSGQQPELHMPIGLRLRVLATLFVEAFRSPLTTNIVRGDVKTNKVTVERVRKGN